jgi:hypothetical protein
MPRSLSWPQRGQEGRHGKQREWISNGHIGAWGMVGWVELEQSHARASGPGISRRVGTAAIDLSERGCRGCSQVSGAREWSGGPGRSLRRSGDYGGRRRQPYIAAIVPDKGETVGEIFGRTAPHPKAPQLEPDKNGLLWVNAEAFRDAIAPNAVAEETMLLAVNQKPIAAACLGEPLEGAAWRQKPSWFLIPEEDRMVSSETQRFTAQRMRASVVWAPIDHWPLASAANTVSDLIAKASGVA